MNLLRTKGRSVANFLRLPKRLLKAAFVADPYIFVSRGLIPKKWASKAIDIYIKKPTMCEHTFFQGH